MGKILIIGLILCLLFYFIARKISAFNFNNTSTHKSTKPIIEITVPTFILQNLLKKTLIIVGTGFLILIIVLVFASKFKLIFILLPLSFYLIGQYFVFSNHAKTLKSQSLLYNISEDILSIQSDTKEPIKINLSKSQILITEVKSVQKNNNLLFGYYEIQTQNNKYYISYLLAENLQNKVFFDRINKIDRNIETKLFPII